METPRPIYDALRYMQYSVNLEEHGSFGLTKNNSGSITLGNENTPLYPLLIATTIRFNDDLKKSLICLLKRKSDESCQLQLDSFVYLQCVLIVITLCGIWLTAVILTKSNIVAWVSAIFALLSGELFYFANRFLTEGLIIPLFSIFILTLCLSFKTKQLRWHAITALILGLLTLTRPEYHYLFLVMFSVQILFCLIRKNNFFWKSLLVVFISYYAIVGPWQARNYHHFDNPSLTGNYGGIILAYRAAYNQMSWTEWAVSFVYWFPDCGDSISKKIFPKNYYEKLNFDEGSYFLSGTRQLMEQIKAETDTPDQALGYLLKNEVIGNLFKHSMVTIPLFWRGIFVSKYWGVIGLLCFTIIVFRFRDPANQKLIFLSLPAWFLAFLHAFVSVNMPRYNLVLIPFYSISIAIVLCSIISFYSDKFIKHNND
ncbi:MAG: hypothetical protein ABGY08_02585 [Gammaproteobacteria bacterium]|jgi:hypothetical protein